MTDVTSSTRDEDPARRDRIDEDTTFGGFVPEATPEPRIFDGTEAAPLDTSEFEVETPPRRRVRPRAAPSEGAPAESLVATGIEAAEAKADEVRHWALDKRETAMGAIRTRPLASCAVAFGAGALMGLLLKR